MKINEIFSRFSEGLSNAAPNSQKPKTEDTDAESATASSPAVSVKLSANEEAESPEAHAARLQQIGEQVRAGQYPLDSDRMNKVAVKVAQELF